MVVNGAEALKAATAEEFDLILMDIQMPVMNGQDATIAIRKKKKIPHRCPDGKHHG